LNVPGWSSITERCRISSASSTCTNCGRASRPHTVGTSGWARERGRGGARGADLGTAAPEAADVALDGEDVAGERAAWHGAGLGVLGEDGRILERRAARRPRGPGATL